MSKKVVRSRESYIKNWTAAITGSFVLVSAQAASAHERGAFREFRANNPGLEKRELRQAFREQFGSAGNHICPVPNSGGSNSAAPQISRQEARMQARMLRHDGALKHTFQADLSGQINNVQRGVDLDLTSQVANITLGEKLFGNTSSIEIQVGGVTKTLSAGAQVTAAEYVAAKQVLAGVGQRVTIGAGGGATGGDVDLSAITTNGDVMRASNLTVPVNVTATGDFSRGSDFRLLGDLDNSGNVHATDSTGGGRGGTLRADDILNNASGSITSDVDLNLHADGSLVNHGNISSQGNLTITSSDITNRGNISSANDVNLNANAEAGGLNVDNTGGTISAANDINVNAADLDANLVGGNYLSQNLNLHAGAGTITAALDDVTGNVKSDGYAVHFSSATETLNIGDTDLVDPTFFNTGNINLTGSINVAGADLTVIATGDITESAGSFNISTTGAGNGGNLNLIAGANITAADQPGNGTVGAGTPAQVTFNQGSISGGSILLGNAQLITSGAGGGFNGGNVLLVAFEGIGGTKGVVSLANGPTSTGSTITTSGTVGGVNGNVTVIAPNGIDLNANGSGTDAIVTTGGTGGGGAVRITTAQPTSTGPVTYLADGSLSSGQVVAGTIIENAAVDVNTITANGLISIVAGSDVTTAGALTTAAANSSILIFAGVDPTNIIDPAAELNLGGGISANGAGSNVVIATADNFNQGNNNILADTNLVIDVGINTPGASADYAQNGSLTATNGAVFVTVGDNYTIGNSTGDSITGNTGVTIVAGFETGAGDINAIAPITAGGGASDGSVSITALGGDFNVNNAAGDITAGQGGGGFLGTVFISADEINTNGGANILGRDVTMVADTTNTGGDVDIAGSVTANKGGDTTGIFTFTQNGSNNADIGDVDFSGGITASQMTFTNNTPGGTITFLNTGTPINFRNVTANAPGDITIVEPNGGGRDGNINFTGSSSTGGNFTVVADSNISGSLGAMLLGVNGDLRSSGVGGNGNIGVSAADRLTVDFDTIRVQALGGPSATAGNVFLEDVDDLQFAGLNSVATDTLDVLAAGDLTTDAATTVVGTNVNLESTAGSIGTGLFTPFNVDAGGFNFGDGVTANAFNDVFLFDSDNQGNESAVAGSSSAGGLFSFVTDGANLYIDQDVTGGTGVILDSAGNLEIYDDVTASAGSDAAIVAGNNIINPTGQVIANDLTVDIGGTGNLNTAVDSISTVNTTGGNLSINEADGINVESQVALSSLTINASLFSDGDIFTNQAFSVGDLDLNNTGGGNILVNSDVTGTVSVQLDTSTGTGFIAGTGTVISPQVQLSANADITTSVNGIGGGDTVVGAAAVGNDVNLTYVGSGTITLSTSSGNNDFTATVVDPLAIIEIGGGIDGTGILNLTTNTLNFGGAFTLAFDSANVQSLALSGLTINGANGTFDTNAAGPGVSFIATDGDFVGTGNTNFLNGNLTVTLANNDGINAFDIDGVGNTLTGDGTNDVTINAAVVVGTSLANLINWANINLIGNTIYNSNGDIALPLNLTFTGQDLAIIASGNVTAGAGTVINLSSTTGDGGNLTILAGFTTTPPSVNPGGDSTSLPVTVTGFSLVPGNISIAGATINTSTTDAGGADAGDVFIYATGTTTVGSITSTAVNGNGGFVAVGGGSGVTTGSINTTGSTAGGDIALGVGSVLIVGTPTFTGGQLSGGGFLPDALSTGDLLFSNLTAGTGDVLLAGGLAIGDTISGGTVQGDNLEVAMGSGSANLVTDVNEVQADATAGAGGSLTVNEANDINVDGINGTDTLVSVITGGDITLIGDINLGALGEFSLSADDVFTATTEKITANILDIGASNTATVNTNVNTLTTSADGVVQVTEDDGLALGAQSAGVDLTVFANFVGAGDVTTSADFTVADLAVETDGSNIVINNQVTGSNSVTLDTSLGGGSINGTGTVLSPSIDLFADTGNISLNVNGIGGLDTDVLAEAASGGDVTLTYLGTGTMTLFGSTGNGNYTVAGTALNGGNIAIDGDIDGTGSLSITTDNLSFASASELAFDDITVQSFAGTDLTIDGTAGLGTFTTTDGGNGTSFTSTDGDLNFFGNTQYNGGDVFATLGLNNGINAYNNTGNLNGDTLNTLTITAALLTGGGTETNFANVIILQGNTIVNNSGDVTLPANLIFNGQSLAIIASGNVIATGAVLIDLSSAVGDGGDLTILAGFNSSGTTVGNIITQTADPVTVTGFSTTGGNVSLAGLDIDVSSSFSDSGSVNIVAASGAGFANAGTVVTGDITATGANDGGNVRVYGFSGVTVGDIDVTEGTGASGIIDIGVVDVVINGANPVFTNGVQTAGGTIDVSGGTAGNLLYGNLDAGSGDIIVGGAFGAANTIGGGQITGDDLLVYVGAGSANLATDVFDIAVDATGAAGGSVAITENDDVTVSSVTGADVDLAITTTGGIEFDGAIAAGAGTVTLTADGIFQTSGSLAANSLSFSATGDVVLDVNLAINNLLDSNGAVVDLLNNANLVVNDLTATDFLSIINNGTLTVTAGEDILSNQSIFLQTANAGTINIGAGATIITAVAVKVNPGDGDVTILQGAAPTKFRNLKGKNLDVTLNGGVAQQGKGAGTKKITALAPDNLITAQGANVLIKAQVKNGVTLGGGVVITADPPVAPGTKIITYGFEPKNAEPTASFSQALASAPSALAPINSVPTLTSAPSINLNNIENALSNLATANTNLGALSQMEDDSYITTYAPMGHIVDGHLCSDMDFGFVSGANAGSGSAVATMKHSDCVTLDNGSALFVPSKDMTVVTPKGSVKLAAHSVAFVSVNSNQLSVYDINDNHKSSVVVSTGGRDLTLSPGRHLVVTHDKAKTFADVNPIESIMHRSVNRHNLGAGKQAFVSEFSIPSAVNVVKPLKAMLNSNDANAKKVAARILKTTAVVMMVGGQAPFDFHAKPRTVALNWK